MRIVAGRHKGRRLVAPAGRDSRPTADRARQALFNILAHAGADAGTEAGGDAVTGACVLDAFAGTGALGLEALSRGALHATFLDTAAAALAACRANVQALGEEGRVTVLRADATRPPPAGRACRLVLLDPPYHSGLAGPGLVALAGQGWLEPDALAVVEVAAREEFAAPAGFETVDERRYGAARLVFLRRRAI